MKEVEIPIAEIYVPVKRKPDVDPERVKAIAESILEEGQQQAIQVRRDDDKKRYVLVAGLQRLEAMTALGEETIRAVVVQARKF